MKESSCHDTKMAAYCQEIRQLEDKFDGLELNHVPRRLNEAADALVKALVWFWLIDETLSANLVYQSDYEIGSTTPSDEAMVKIMTMVMAW